jgi:hypothetical protein
VSDNNTSDLKPPFWYAGMDADTIARAKASDNNLRGIIAGRLRAARMLLVPSRAPEFQTRDETAALLGDQYNGPPRIYPTQ